MSAQDLKRELIALQKNFLGGAIGKMKRHELDHRLAVFKQAMALKESTSEDEPTKAGPPKARLVKTEIVALDDETMITKPIAPVGGKIHSTSYTKKPKAAAVAAAEPGAAAATEAPAEKPKKARIVPPKVVLPDAEPVVKKIVKKRVPKPAAEKPVAAAAAAAPELVVEKLPSGVKKMGDAAPTLS